MRVMIVDDDERYARTLEAFLGAVSDIDVVATRSSAEDAIRDLPTLRPDVIVMDISMPGADGIEATRIIVEQDPGARIILVSASEAADVRGRATEAGAIEFVPKRDVARVLPDVIRRVAGRAVRVPIAEKPARAPGRETEVIDGSLPRSPAHDARTRRASSFHTTLQRRKWVREVRKYLCLALVAVMLLAVPLAAYATPSVAISDDLVGQAVGKCIKVTVKVHPTIWMDTFDEAGTQVDELAYTCLNPYDNPTATLGFDWVVYSNLPFYKTISWQAMTWADPQPSDLMSYQFIDGQWVLVADPDGAGPDTLDAQKIFVDGVEIANGWVSSLHGDIDNHGPFTERVAWQVGPINWCTTAGYYTGTLCVAAYQN